MAPRLQSLARRGGFTVAFVLGCGIGALVLLTRDSESFDTTYGVS